MSSQSTKLTHLPPQRTASKHSLFFKYDEANVVTGRYFMEKVILHLARKGPVETGSSVPSFNLV